jgi:thiamine pyrophosphate-dependent acetolactate synthase large subunit-like protein
MAEITLDRRGLLAEIFPNHAEYLIVTGLAGAAKDTAALTQESPNLITMGGAMGAAVSMGLGVALGAPDRKVAVITGDGELMMNVGALATVASMMPENLTIICIDNGAHGETGMQAGHTSKRTNLALMAEGAGLPSTFTLTGADQFAEARRFLAEAPAPRFLRARVMPGPPTAYKRNWDLVQGRLKFRTAYLASKS